jgi:hypothetical protein
MPSGIWLIKEDCPITPEEQNLIQTYPYSNIIGSLIYAIINSKPDCAYAVCSLAQYLSNPSNTHIQTLKRTLRYIKETFLFGIKYQKQDNGEILHGFSGADWAGDKDTRRSTFGYCFLLVGGVISWGSKKQQSIGLSSTKLEDMALLKATAEAVWLRHLLSELGFSQSNPTIIYSDRSKCYSSKQKP